MSEKNQWTLEWREHGRWIMSTGTFESIEAAKEHVEMIGAFGKIRILPSKESEVRNGRTND